MCAEHEKMNEEINKLAVIVSALSENVHNMGETLKEIKEEKNLKHKEIYDKLERLEKQQENDKLEITESQGFLRGLVYAFSACVILIGILLSTLANGYVSNIASNIVSVKDSSMDSRMDVVENRLGITSPKNNPK